MKTGGEVKLILLWNEQKKGVIGDRKGPTHPLLLNNGRYLRLSMSLESFQISLKVPDSRHMVRHSVPN
jgi:hypothetical protein